MKRYLSMFGPKYPRSLVYIFQASEYFISDYFEWYWRVDDFSSVEKVGHLETTPKATFLLVSIWLEYLGLIVLWIWFFFENLSRFGLLPLVLGLFIPLLLAYLAVIPVVLFKYIVQFPAELLIQKRLKQRISAHPGIKIAIAGSYGKTTMREILRSVISAGQKVASPDSSVNTLLGIYNFVKKLTGDEKVLLFELGEYYPGDVMKLAKIVEPDIGVITGINESHLKRFKTLDKTVATIYELVDYLGQKPVYINGENRLAAENARGNFLIYSASGIGGWKVSEAKTGLTGTDFVLHEKNGKIQFHTELIGLHLVGPIVGAAYIAKELGLNDKEIVEGVAAAKPFARRLELKSNIGGIAILDDSYNGNPDGVKAVIEFLKSLQGYRIIYITSGLVEMGDRTREVHLEIGKELAEAKIAKVLLIRTSATQIIAEGLEKAHYGGEISWFDDTDSAYKALPLMTIPGDIVLMQNDWPDQYF